MDVILIGMAVCLLGSSLLDLRRRVRALEDDRAGFEQRKRQAMASFYAPEDR